jgi:hypothetical protein
MREGAMLGWGREGYGMRERDRLGWGRKGKG